MKRKQYTIDHIHLTSSKPFVAVRADFEARLGSVDEAPYQTMTRFQYPTRLDARRTASMIQGSSLVGVTVGDLLVACHDNTLSVSRTPVDQT
jgi:hypothetical protein